MKRKKNIPPAIGIFTTFKNIAAQEDIVNIPIIAIRFLPPHVSDSTRFAELAKAP